MQGLDRSLVISGHARVRSWVNDEMNDVPVGRQKSQELDFSCVVWRARQLARSCVYSLVQIFQADFGS